MRTLMKNSQTSIDYNIHKNIVKWEDLLVQEVFFPHVLISSIFLKMEIQNFPFIISWNYLNFVSRFPIPSYDFFITRLFCAYTANQTLTIDLQDQKQQFVNRFGRHKQMVSDQKHFDLEGLDNWSSTCSPNNVFVI